MRLLTISKYIRTAKLAFLNQFNDKYPFYASFKVTLRCQFACSFCNIWNGPKTELNTEDCLKIIDNLGTSSILMTSFEGGEPLLRPDIEDLLREAARQPFYTMFTTSQRNLMDYPWERYQRHIDFLEISIDEGHKNLKLFETLSEINRFDFVVCVQTVVRKKDQFNLEEKVRKCEQSKCKILLMPAANLDGAKDDAPDLDLLEREILRLKKMYPRVIITPNSFFARVRKKSGGCSPNSIVIDADGSLYYPCRPRENKTIKLQNTRLMPYLISQGAREKRKEMKSCTRQCGWYQYFATPAFASMRDFWDAFNPYFWDFINNGNEKKPDFAYGD